MNAVYQTALNAALNALLGITPGPSSPATISAQAVTSAYTPNTAANGDQYFSAVASGDRLASKVHLGSITTSGGVLSAANTDLGTAWTGNPTIQAVVVFIDTGVDSTSQLLFYIDGFQQVETMSATTSGATSIPIVPLAFGIASGASFTLGGQSVTLSAAYTAGQFALSVSATGGSIAQGATGQAPILNAGLPFTTTNGSDVVFAWANGIVGQI